MTETLTTDASRAHLFGRLNVLEGRIGAWVETRRAVDPAPDDPFRGLYITDDAVDRLLGPGRPDGPPVVLSADSMLARVEAAADRAEENGADLRLRRMARSFDLAEGDVQFLLVALAPDVDPSFERLYAYLHDDVSRRRASTGLALELCPAWGGAGRARFHASAALVAGGLLVVEEDERPFLTRSLRVPDRVAAHLLGDDTPDELVGAAISHHAEAEFLDTGVAVRALLLGHRPLYVREGSGAAGYAFAVAALARAGRPVVQIDLGRLDGAHDLTALATMAIREARLRGGGLVAGPLDAIADAAPRAIELLARASCPVLLVGSRPWDPRWSSEPPLVIDAPVPTASQREALWRAALDEQGSAAAAATVQFRLTPEQVSRAAGAARRSAAAHDRPLASDDLHAAARAQNATGLERLARRIRPRVVWEDLVLPGEVTAQLADLVARLRHRERVLDIWGLGRTSSRGRGITCLFTGESGTGKTMSAEVVAGDLGLDLYVVDLSSVVDKYVGETEKNLDRVFAEADRVNGVLLFDEADALFGKRSEIKDAKDRWANVEVAYLLQRMELFDGIAILTTNLRSNLDEAFTRRLDVLVDFPPPDEEHRRAIWERKLDSGVPLDTDVDTAFLAASFKLTGGEIRNAVLTAAYLAADSGGPVGMPHLVRGIQREYRKLGRLCVEGEFGRYHALVSSPGT